MAPRGHYTFLTTDFDPAAHLVTNPINGDTPTATMKSLGIEDSPLSSTAFTGPFPLLTPEAVRLHRQELFQPRVLEACMYQTKIESPSVQLRGFAPAHAPFIHQFWISRRVTDIVSKAAGVPLEPVMDYEICHANIQVKSPTECGKSHVEQIKEFPVEVSTSSTTEPDQELTSLIQNSRALNKEDMVVDWHKDCYPFVVILMLSSPEGMSGGETVVCNGKGEYKFIKAPSVGQILVFQGGRIDHAALPALGGAERITLVTSYRPSSILSPERLLSCDISHLGNVRHQSRLSELYYQWAMYRLSVAEKAITEKRQRLMFKYVSAHITEFVPCGPLERNEGDCHTKVVDLADFKNFMSKLVEYLNKTTKELAAIGEYSE